MKLTRIAILLLTLSLGISGFAHPAVRDSLKFLQWAPTPPMGWNSWDCYGPTVTEKEVKANASYMAHNLKKFGWKYIVVDIRWYVSNPKTHGYNETNPEYCLDQYGRFVPSPVRFPSAANNKGFKPLADYVHHLGLKFGIHIMRGIPKIAVKENTPILNSPYHADDIYNTNELCQWLHDMYTVDATKAGAQAYYNSLFDLYASWGVDFVKVDDLSRPYHKDEIDMIRKAIDQCGRPIVLSTSPGATPITEADHIETHANMWRIMDDFWDNWPEEKAHFALFEQWIRYSGYGHWPDGDMLPLGRIGIRSERGNNRLTHFTPDEQYTLMSLFAICKSPLIFGGDLPSNDAFTLSLITNPDVLYIDQHSIHNRLLKNDNGIVIWTADSPKGDKYLAVFNATDDQNPQHVSVNRQLAGVASSCMVTNIWTHKTEGHFGETFTCVVPRHGVKLYKLQKRQ
ncbi:glycoside hydrolase family 27 protein [Microbacter margulisiae]|uniref:Alpha-galactosidase n=1 Tax=Microbacter margulisiae TaxID=1350067 RepID=A0A7W5H2Z7_9PORP|nr:glycoside hydrolase family 27 protein [Microbacter margulisiae]MBB3188300.1 hypothetical protein [Microbacter margulisiae]